MASLQYNTLYLKMHYACIVKRVSVGGWEDAVL